MRSIVRLLPAVLITGATLLGLAETAEAGHPRFLRLSKGERGHHRLRSEADIDSLRGELYHARREWRLRIRYEVEIEDALPFEQFELQVRVYERGRPVLDMRRRPLVIVLPLRYPTDVDDDELEFEDRVTVRLPYDAVCNPKRLKLEALVVRLNDGRVLDDSRRSVKFRKHR